MIQIVIDELHMMLRITDILMRNLIWGAANEDQKDILKESTEKMDLLVEKVRACGVTFQVCGYVFSTSH